MLRAATPVPVSLGSPIIGLGRFVHLTLLVVAALVVPAVGFQVAACTDHGLPVQPRTSGPQFEIQDGAHNSGNAHFFFLPPMVAQPAVSGTFDGDLATLNPLVAICDITYGPDVDCGSNATPATVVFTTATTPAITVDPTTPQYQVNWDTQGANFVGGHTYRVHLTAGATRTRRELGFADIMLTTTPGQAKRAATGDLILIKDGRTLPIHFRIETGIVGAVAVVPAIRP